MIKEIKIKDSWKKNWLDDNGVLIGYDAGQQCCEEFEWGVYEKDTGRFIAETPNGLPYHFAKHADEEPERHYCKDGKESTECECHDYVLIDLLPDDDSEGKPILVFEFNCHNGYYSHDFEMKVDFADSNPEQHEETLTKANEIALSEHLEENLDEANPISLYRAIDAINKINYQLNGLFLNARLEVEVCTNGSGLRVSYYNQPKPDVVHIVEFVATEETFDSKFRDLMSKIVVAIGRDASAKENNIKDRIQKISDALNEL